MRHRLRISASVTALVAAASVCATGAAAAILLAASPAAAQEYNTENDVHAVPSGVVDAAALGKVGAAASTTPDGTACTSFSVLYS